MSNKEKISINIDGVDCPAESGMTILQVARENGFDIPTLCHDSRLEPYGSCLLCVVEVEGMRKPVLSCATEIRPGMKIRTRTPRIESARRNALEMLLSSHYADCRGACYEQCPAHVDVQGYLALAHEGRYRESLELIREANPLPLICGRVCVRYCEAFCRRQNVDSPVGINFVKRYVADLESDNLPKPVMPKSDGRKVAIVGGGPAGLTAAYFLAKKGFKVTIFDAQSHLGGMLKWGIPDYRLPPGVIDKEIAYILAYGINVETCKRLGKDFTLADLKKQGYEAVLLAIGAWTAKKMGVKNESAHGMMTGIGFLESVKKEGPKSFQDTVLVVGGGNTAVDAARTALRCKAARVVIVYRRTIEEMPADKIEIEDAMAEGVEVKFLTAPLEVVTKDGKISGLSCQAMKLGEPGPDGRRKPVPIDGEVFVIPCSDIIAAIGQDADLSCLANEPAGEVKVTRRQTIEVDEATCSTSIPGVFSAGDVVTGPKAAVDAIGAGRRSAEIIAHYLRTGELKPWAPEFLSKKANLKELPASYFENIEKTERSKMRQTDPKTRIANFSEVDMGIEPADIPKESSRCLVCGCSDVFHCELKKLAADYQVDQTKFRGKINSHEVDEEHPYIKLDPNKCILCGKCVRLCAQLIGCSALGLVHRGFDTVVKPSMGRTLLETTCVSCGNCIDICPTGAIDFKSLLKRPGPWLTAAQKSVCNFCPVGCELQVNKFSDQIWNLSAGERSAPENAVAGERGMLCAMGRFGHHLLRDLERIETPLLKSDSGFVPASLPDAIEKAAEMIETVKNEAGPEAIAVFASPFCTNEEMFLAGKLARDVLKTSNLSSLGQLASVDDVQNLDYSCEKLESTVKIGELRHADVIICVGSGIEENNPVLGFEIRMAQKKGAKLISMNSEASRLASCADLELKVNEGAMSVLLGSLVREIIERNAFGKEIAEPGNNNFEEFRNTEMPSLNDAEEICEIEKSKLSSLTSLLADDQLNVIFVCAAPDPVRNAEYTDILRCIWNLMLLTSRAERANNGMLIARNASNEQGLRNSGIWPGFDPDTGLSGAVSPGDLKNRMLKGEIRAVVTIGENLAASTLYHGILSSLNPLVAFDQVHNETSAIADVVFPAAFYLETDGSVTTTDGSVKYFSKVFEPPAGVTGVDALSGLVERLGGRKYESIDDIRTDMMKDLKLSKNKLPKGFLLCKSVDRKEEPAKKIELPTGLYSAVNSVSRRLKQILEPKSSSGTSDE